MYLYCTLVSKITVIRPKTLIRQTSQPTKKTIKNKMHGWSDDCMKRVAKG